MKKLKGLLIAFLSVIVIGSGAAGVWLSFLVDKEESEKAPIVQPIPAVAPLSYVLSDDADGYVLKSVREDAVGTIKIPATHNDLPVVGVNLTAFDECSEVTEVIVEADIELEHNIFSGLEKLEKLTLSNTKTAVFQLFDDTDRTTVPQSLKEVVYNALDDVTAFECAPNPFLGCYDVEEITINAKAMPINDNLFEDCLNLKYLTLNTSEISGEGEKLFEANERLRTVSLKSFNLKINAENATEINEAIFDDCEELRLLEINAPNVTLDENLVSACNNLTSLSLNIKKITSKGNKFFANSNLDEIIIQGTNVDIEAPYVEAFPEFFFADCENVETIVIDAPNLKINDTIFASVSNLNSLTFNAKEIETSNVALFMNNPSIEVVYNGDELTISGNNLTSLYEEFLNNTQIKSLSLNTPKLAVKDTLFSTLTGIESLTLNVAEISTDENLLFADFDFLNVKYSGSKLKVVGQYLETVPENWFTAELKSLIIDAPNVEFNDSVVADCLSLSTIELNVAKIKSEGTALCGGREDLVISFTGTQLVVEGENLLSLPVGLVGTNLTRLVLETPNVAFDEVIISDCTNLESVELTVAKITTTGTSLFEGFDGLDFQIYGSTISIEGLNLTSIPASIFENQNITTIVLNTPNISLTDDLIAGATNVLSLTFNVKDITTAGETLFAGNAKLESIVNTGTTLAINGENIISVDEGLFNSSLTLLKLNTPNMDFNDAIVAGCSKLTTIELDVARIITNSASICGANPNATISFTGEILNISGANLTTLSSGLINSNITSLTLNTPKYAFSESLISSCQALTKIELNVAKISTTNATLFAGKSGSNVNIKSTSLTIEGTNLTSIPSYVFNNNLTTLTLNTPNFALTNTVLANATNVASLTFNVKSITTTGTSLFPSNTKLTTRNNTGSRLEIIGTNLTSIPTIGSNTNLTTLILNTPKVTSIPSSLITTKLTALTLNTPLVSFADSQVAGCTNLSSISLNVAKITSTYVSLFNGKSGLTVSYTGTNLVVEGSNLTSVLGSLFNSNLTSIDIKAPKITGFSDGIFANCTKLVSLSIPNASKAFYYLFGSSSSSVPTSLKSLKVNNIVHASSSGVVSAGYFAGMTGLTHLTLDGTATSSISSNALSSLTNLTSIGISADILNKNTIKAIFTDAVAQDFVEVIVYRGTTTSFSSNRLQGLTSKCKLTIPLSILNYQSYLYSHFGGSSASYISTIPSEIIVKVDSNQIKGSFFQNCTTLKSVTFDGDVSGLTTVGSTIFKSCTSLKEVIFTSTSVPTKAASNMFNGCTQGVTVYVPDASLSAYQTYLSGQAYCTVAGISTKS